MSSQRTRQTPSRDAIVRAVASSTAIETGQRIAVIEAKLRSAQAASPLLSLALNRPARPVPR
jgi:hypothetical protein